MTRITGTLLTFIALLLLTPALAQDAFQDFDVTEVEPFGDVDLTFGAYDDELAGALVLSHSTPGDQHANFDVVGPDDYLNHFDFSDDPGEELVLDGLAPGVYSVAATDEGLNLSHTLVEIRAGESATVHFNLEPWDENFVAGTYDPYAYYGRYGQGVYPGYPYGAYGVSPYSPYGQAARGALSVETGNENIDYIVTGPNGYSQEFEGDFVVENLLPGVYAIAATEQGLDLAVTTVEIQAERQLAVNPTLVALGESDFERAQEAVDGDDVAGGGAGAEDQDDGADVDLDVDGDEGDRDQQQDGAGQQDDAGQQDGAQY